MVLLYRCLILSFLYTASYSQSKETPILERVVSITANDEKVTTLLNRLGQAAQFSFSYNSSLIAENQTVSIVADKKSVRDILNQVFKGTIQYKQKGSYLILTKAQVPVVKNNVAYITINGYVIDNQNGDKISGVSVYEKTSLESSTTNEFGYFKLKLEKKVDSLTISVNKRNYNDTTVFITSADNQYLSIYLSPIEYDTVKATVMVADSTEDEINPELSFPYEQEPNVQNINDTIYRLGQISFLPFIGTNELLSGNVINDYSFNILGGYSLGTKQMELGLFLNMDRGDVSWFQAAGFGNLVGRNVNGIQLAGFANVNGGEMNAVQVAGFANTNFGNSQGVQVSGFSNTNMGSMNGVQVAGFSNFTKGPSYGVQVAGLINIQIDDYQGSQFAGLTNVAVGNIKGSQTATLFNFGKNVNGAQVGLINYADSLGGVPLGLFSIVKKGYHKIELSADEVFYTNLSFRTGVRKFYTLLMAGFKPEKSLGVRDTSVWTFGYGMGTARKLTRWLFLNIDASAQHINKGGFTNTLSLLNKIHLGLDFQISKNFSIYSGITVNGYLTRIGYSKYPSLFDDYQPTIFYNNDISTTNLKMWLGAKVAFRFL